MANNYTQFSEAIVLENDEQREWVRNYKFLAERLKREEYGAADPDKMTADELIEAAEGALDSGYTGAYGCVGFQSEVDNGNWWIYAEEYGEPRAAAEAVQDFMLKFHFDKPFVLSWAATCSKMRVGEFTGGCIVVAPEEIKSFDPWRQANEYISSRLAGKS